MLKITILLLSLLGCTFDLKAQAIDYERKIELIQINIWRYFYSPKKMIFYENLDKPGKVAFLWPLCALLQSEVELSKINFTPNKLKETLHVIEQYRTTTRFNAYQATILSEKRDDRYYDDNEWLALTFLDIYKGTKDKRYLTRVFELYKFIQNGIDRKDGGIYWRYGINTSKNTCSNAPFIILSVRLFELTGKNEFLKNAITNYEWINKHLRSDNNLFYDALLPASRSIDKNLFSYNTGLMLDANCRLFLATHDEKYKTEARKIAKSAKDYFYRLNVLTDDYWFSAVLFRGFLKFKDISGEKHILDFLINDANRIWKEERDNKNLIGLTSQRKLIDQAAMLEIYSHLQRIKSEGNL